MLDGSFLPNGKDFLLGRFPSPCPSFILRQPLIVLLINVLESGHSKHFIDRGSGNSDFWGYFPFPFPLHKMFHGHILVEIVFDF